MTKHRDPEPPKSYNKKTAASTVSPLLTLLTVNPIKLETDQGQKVLEFPTNYSSGLKLLGFQLLGFYCKPTPYKAKSPKP